MISMALTQARRATRGPAAFAIEASFELGIRLSAIQAALLASTRAAARSRSVAASRASTKGRRRDCRGISVLDQSVTYSKAARPIPMAMAATPGREASKARRVALNPDAGRRASSPPTMWSKGMRQSSKTSSAVSEAVSPSLCSIRPTAMPGVPLRPAKSFWPARRAPGCALALPPRTAARAPEVKHHRRLPPRQLLAAHNRHHPVGAWPAVEAHVGPQRRNDRRPVPGHLAQPGDDLRLHGPRQVGGAGTRSQLVDGEGVQE